MSVTFYILRADQLSRSRRFGSALQPPSAVLAKVSAGVVEAENGNSRDHGERLEHPEEPLISKSVPVHTLGELNNAENTANLLGC